MDNNNNLYKVYGINGALAIMDSNSCTINEIILSSDFQVERLNNQSKLLAKYRSKTQILSKGKFKNKYDSLRKDLEISDTLIDDKIRYRELINWLTHLKDNFSSI